MASSTSSREIFDGGWASETPPRKPRVVRIKPATDNLEIIFERKDDGIWWA
jgi:hypothetical protein